MSDIKKFLDQEGVALLWQRTSEDYVDNNTLTAVVNAIDETKENKKYNWYEIKYTFTESNMSNTVTVSNIENQTENKWNEIVKIYDQTGRTELNGATDYPAILSVLMMLKFVLNPPSIDDNYRLTLTKDIIIPNLETLIAANVISTDLWFAVNSGLNKIDHINIWTTDNDTYNFIISESTYRPSTAYLSYCKSTNSFTYNTLKPVYGYTDTSLSMSGAAADAKATGDAIAAIDTAITPEECQELLDELNTDLDTTEPYKTLLETIVANQTTLEETQATLMADHEALYYQPGDSYKVHIDTAGYLTTDGTKVTFALPLDKPCKNVTAASMTNPTAVLRQNGVYLMGGSNTWGVVDTIKFVIRNGYLNAAITLAEMPTNAINNETIAVALDGTVVFE